MTRLTILAGLLVLFGMSAQAENDGAVASTAADQSALALTIYNDNLALVRDTRQIALPKGLARLDYADVSAQIIPETATLKGGRFTLVEQNFDFDLLNPGKLLEKAVGQTVRLFRTHPTTGQDTVEEATVLSANGGAVLRVGDRIEVIRGTNLAGRIVFDQIPPNLRARPTLSILLDNRRKSDGDLQLTYLTGGLSWQADYVGTLNEDETGLDLQGWVTLTNNSGIGYRNAAVQVVAGTPNRVYAPQRDFRRERLEEVVVTASVKVKEEALLDYHLYTLPRATTIANNQTKQVAFMAAPQVQVNKIYEFTAFGVGTSDWQPAVVFIEMYNTEEAGLGLPLPKGIVRLYKADSKGQPQFVGEDRIAHTPEGEEARLTVGQAFDVTVSRRQIDYRDESRGQGPNRIRQFRATQEVTLKNAKEEPVAVDFIQRFYGDWEILEESAPHVKRDAEHAVWTVDIPAKGETTVTFQVRWKQ